jgi:hypothetical protein
VKLVQSDTWVFHHSVTSDKNLWSKVFVLTQIKSEYSDILYNPTNFPGHICIKKWFQNNKNVYLKLASERNINHNSKGYVTLDNKNDHNFTSQYNHVSVIHNFSHKKKSLDMKQLHETLFLIYQYHLYHIVRSDIELIWFYIITSWQLWLLNIILLNYIVFLGSKTGRSDLFI